MNNIWAMIPSWRSFFGGSTSRTTQNDPVSRDTAPSLSVSTAAINPIHRVDIQTQAPKYELVLSRNSATVNSESVSKFLGASIFSDRTIQTDVEDVLKNVSSGTQIKLKLAKEDLKEVLRWVGKLHKHMDRPTQAWTLKTLKDIFVRASEDEEFANSLVYKASSNNSDCVDRATATLIELRCMMEYQRDVSLDDSSSLLNVTLATNYKVEGALRDAVIKFAASFSGFHLKGNKAFKESTEVYLAILDLLKDFLGIPMPSQVSFFMHHALLAGEPLKDTIEVSWVAEQAEQGVDLDIEQIKANLHQANGANYEQLTQYPRAMIMGRGAYPTQEMRRLTHNLSYQAGLRQLFIELSGIKTILRTLSSEESDEAKVNRLKDTLSQVEGLKERITGKFSVDYIDLGTGTINYKGFAVLLELVSILLRTSCSTEIKEQWLNRLLGGLDPELAVENPVDLEGEDNTEEFQESEFNGKVIDILNSEEDVEIKWMMFVSLQESRELAEAARSEDTSYFIDDDLQDLGLFISDLEIELDDLEIPLHPKIKEVLEQLKDQESMPKSELSEQLQLAVFGDDIIDSDFGAFKDEVLYRQCIELSRSYHAQLQKEEAVATRLRARIATEIRNAGMAVTGTMQSILTSMYRNVEELIYDLDDYWFEETGSVESDFPDQEMTVQRMLEVAKIYKIKEELRTVYSSRNLPVPAYIQEALDEQVHSEADLLASLEIIWEEQGASFELDAPIFSSENITQKCLELEAYIAQEKVDKLRSKIEAQTHGLLMPTFLRQMLDAPHKNRDSLLSDFYCNSQFDIELSNGIWTEELESNPDFNKITDDAFARTCVEICKAQYVQEFLSAGIPDKLKEMASQQLAIVWSDDWSYESETALLADIQKLTGLQALTVDNVLAKLNAYLEQKLDEKLTEALREETPTVSAYSGGTLLGKFLRGFRGLEGSSILQALSKQLSEEPETEPSTRTVTATSDATIRSTRISCSGFQLPFGSGLWV